MPQEAIEELVVVLGRERPVAIEPVNLLEQDGAVQMAHGQPSHSWSLTQLSRRAPATLAGFPQPVALPASLEDRTPMGEAVEGRSCRALAAQHLRPLLEWQVRRHDHARSLVRRADHVEQQLGTNLARRHVAQLVQHQQVQLRQLRPQPGQLTLLTCLHQERRQFGDPEEPHPLAPGARLCRQRRGQVRLPRAAPADQQYVLTSGDIFTPHELQYQRLVHRRRGREVEPVQALGRREPGRLQPTGSGPPLAVQELQFGQLQQEPQVVDILLGAPRRHLLALGRHGRQLQRLEVVLQQHGALGRVLLHDATPAVSPA